MSTNDDAQTQLPRITNPHSLPLTKLALLLGTDTERGLTSNEAAQRLTLYGPNMLPRIKGSFWRVYLAPILNGLITIYLISAVALWVISFVQFLFNLTPSFPQWYIWFGVIILNGLLAIVQQWRAQKKLEALQALAPETTTVVRDGAKRKIDAREIVPGDLLSLAQGDRVPADARLLEANHFQVVEASLTGESAAVVKSATEEPLIPDAPLHARTNMVYRGTFVATGSGQSVVTGTGQRTEIGKISQGLETLSTRDIPLRRKVNRLALFLGLAVVALLLISFFYYVVQDLLSGELTLDTVLSSASLSIISAMTVMPINIPLLTTIILLTGVLLMATRGVVVRDLSAVESLGRVSVICTDKTGTLTRSEMMVGLVWDGESLYRVTGQGYDPDGALYRTAHSSNSRKAKSELLVKWDASPRLDLLLTIGALNNDAELTAEESGRDKKPVWRAIGDPTEAALLALLHKAGLDLNSLRSRYQMVQDYPFDPRLRRMTRIFARSEGDYLVFVKGATDILLSLCTRVGDEQAAKKLTSKRQNEIAKLADEFAAKGYRVLSFAVGHLSEVSGEKAPAPRKAIEQELTYVGFVCMVDPPREGVREAVLECTKAGINTVMLTGDALATARTIGQQLAIVDGKHLVVEGKDARKLSDDQFERVRVFARMDPDDKQVIVKRYMDAKRAVAVTGDGVNDALALGISDVGIAMGITGTDVAKEAADMIVSDDSFTSIVDGIRQGRGLFNKVRMMVLFYICINVAESIAYFVTSLMGIFILTSLQKLFVTLSSHSWPGLALVFDRTAKDVMQEAPRDTEAIITRRLGAYLLLNSFLILLGVTGAYYLTWSGLLPGFTSLTPFSNDALVKAQLMAVTVLLIAESLMILSIRRINQSLPHSIRHESFWLVYALIGLVFLMHYGLMYIPAVTSILGGFGLNFGYVPLTALDWLFALAFALPTILGMECVKWVSRKRGIAY
jgi:Ca2+-transporting ATPase